MSDDPNFEMRDGVPHYRCECCHNLYPAGGGQQRIRLVEGRRLCFTCKPETPW